jgi:parallel beta-helix repeat protein
MKASKIFLIILTFGIIIQTTQAGIIVVYPDNDLNAILNNTKGGDTVLLKSGTYNNVCLSNKKYSEDNPLVVRAFDSTAVFISGSTTSKGTSFEVISCSYVVIEKLILINSMYGIYVKSSDHIIIKDNEVYNTGQEGIHIGRSSQYVDVL